MSDLERALRDTLANPPVELPGERYPEDRIRWRIEQRRSRQKRTAVGLGVAAAIAAAIAVPVTTMDVGGGQSSNASSSARRAIDAAPHAATAPAAVRTAAQELARRYGITRVEWIQTTGRAWAARQPSTPSTELSTKQTIYVLQVRNYDCRRDCRVQSPSGPVALLTTVDGQGKHPVTTVRPAYDLSALGAVHTLTVR